MIALGALRAPTRRWSTEAALAAALLAGFGPVVWRLSGDEWAEPESGHAPIILALAGFFIVRAWRDGGETGARPLERRAHWLPPLLSGALLYVLGVVGDIRQFAYGALVPVL